MGSHCLSEKKSTIEVDAQCNFPFIFSVILKGGEEVAFSITQIFHSESGSINQTFYPTLCLNYSRNRTTNIFLGNKIQAEGVTFKAFTLQQHMQENS